MHVTANSTAADHSPVPASFSPQQCDHISNVQITFKEPFGTEGRGGYFDEFGIIRDVLQNHLTQVLSLVAMEAPVSLASEDVRDEKVKVLRCVAPIELSDVVLGQYGANAAGTKVGYLDDATVPRDSVTPTFAVARLHINNARWHGVPFILKAGKALNERKAEIRIQFKSSKSGLFNAGEGPIGVGQTPGFAANMHPNELVIRIQPDEAIYVKLMSRLPGLEFSPVETDLALAYSSRFANRASPEAYSRLIYDVIRGEQSQFVRADELVAAWSIFTPLLRRIETERIQPFQYPYGSRGPPQGDMLIQKAGYVWEARYAGAWNKGNVPGAALTALKAVRDEFSLPTARLAKIAANMLGEMREGLAGRPSTVKMIPSFVTAVPTGRESGSSWAIDLGGSNLRVLEVLLEVGQSPRIGREHKVVIPEEVMRGTGAALFDFIATACADAGMVSGAKLGFTFSFPYEQTSISRGTLIEWTKGFSAPNVVGKDVAVLLEEAFVRRSLRIAVSALANDTVGTLCSAAGTHPTTRVGVILGTGTNASYIEQVSRIPKWRGSSQGAMLINMEWGGFGSSAAPLLPLHAVDQSLDVQTPNVGKQRFEKMISGMYLGEIARLLLVQLSAAGGLFAHEGPTVATSKLFTPWSLTTAMLSEIGDDITANLDVVENVLQRLGVAPITAEDKKVVVEVCSLVACRAARLSAAGVAAVITQMGDVGVGSVVGIDGSVFKKTPGFRVAMENALRELGVDCKLVHAEDGALLARTLVLSRINPLTPHSFLSVHYTRY